MIFISNVEEIKSLPVSGVCLNTSIHQWEEARAHTLPQARSAPMVSGRHSLPVFPPVSLVLIKLVEVFLWSWLRFLSHLLHKQVRKLWLDSQAGEWAEPAMETDSTGHRVLCGPHHKSLKTPNTFWWRPARYTVYIAGWMLLKSIFHKWPFIKLYRLLPW